MVKIPNLDNSTIAILAAAAVAAFVITRYAGAAANAVGNAAGAAVDMAGGVLTGNNELTKNATNGAGERTTAYEGWGILGTLGAATNAVSGGVLATAGEKLGGWAYDLTH